jgi:MipA family protein
MGPWSNSRSRGIAVANLVYKSAMRKLLAALLCLPGLALAQEDLGTLLGAGIRSRPEYDGASKQELEPIPLVRYYGPMLFARTTQGILEGGARGELARGLAVGAQLAYEGGNDRTDVDWGASYGLHIEWDTRVGPAPVNLLARTRHHFDSDLGRQTDLRATVGVWGSGGLLAGVFVQATWASDEWVRSYYTTGGGGHLFSAAGIEGAYELGPRWVLLASVHARRLHGDAASSPITEEKTNYYASVGLTYRF